MIAPDRLDQLKALFGRYIDEAVAAVTGELDDIIRQLDGEPGVSGLGLLRARVDALAEAVGAAPGLSWAQLVRAIQERIIGPPAALVSDDAFWTPGMLARFSDDAFWTPGMLARFQGHPTKAGPGCMSGSLWRVLDVGANGLPSRVINADDGSDLHAWDLSDLPVTATLMDPELPDLATRLILGARKAGMEPATLPILLRGRQVEMSETLGPVDGWFATITAYRVKTNPHEGLPVAGAAPVRPPFEAIAHAHGATFVGQGITARTAMNDARSKLQRFAAAISAAQPEVA